MLSLLPLAMRQSLMLSLQWLEALVASAESIGLYTSLIPDPKFNKIEYYGPGEQEPERSVARKITNNH